MKQITFIILLTISGLITGCGELNYVPKDYRIFKNTPVWELAKAVRSNNSDRIRYLIEKSGLDVNYQEENYGFTVLCCAMANSDNFLNMGEIKLSTIRTLLEVGADPNLSGPPDTWGANAVIVACREGFVDGLRLLLEYGGDPNSITKCEGVFKTERTAIIEANAILVDEEISIECIKLLLEYGADINATIPRYYEGGIIEACVEGGRFKVLLFALQSGANPNLPLQSQYLREKGKPVTISLTESLREVTPIWGSEPFINKQPVIDYLQTRGIDYYNTPIPGYVLKSIQKMYPENWREYMETY